MNDDSELNIDKELKNDENSTVNWDAYEYEETDFNINASVQNNKGLTSLSVAVINICLVLFLTVVIVYITRLYLKYKSEQRTHVNYSWYCEYI